MRAEKGVLSTAAAPANILSSFQTSFAQPKSTWTCASNIAGTGPNRFCGLAQAYLGQMIPWWPSEAETSPLDIRHATLAQLHCAAHLLNDVLAFYA